MMKAASLLCVVGVVLTGGCASSRGGIFYRPSAVATDGAIADCTRANLPACGLQACPCHPAAGEAFARTGHCSKAVAHGRPMAEKPTAVLAADIDNAAGGASQPTTQPTTKPAKRPAYTAPASTIQQLSLVTILAAPSAAARSAGAGREAGESSLSSPTGPGGGGLAGLGAPQPRTLTAVVGQPGLQRGFAAGLGFARPDNVFTLRANPLTGPTGRCQELVRVGFFQTQSACEQHFRR